MEKQITFNQHWAVNLKRHWKIWLGRESLANRFVAILIVLSVICGVLTYAALTDVPPFGNSSSALIMMLNIDLVILLTLVVFVCRRLITLYIRRKRGVAGSNLHIRLVFIFSLLAALPAIIMALFSVGFFYFGLHGWLDDRVRTAIEESELVAEAYLHEHQELIKADTMAMATDLDRQEELLSSNPDAMKKMLETQSFLRNFKDVYLFNSIGVVLASHSENETQFNINSLPANSLSEADAGDVVIMNDEYGRIRALLKLRQYEGVYLYVQRLVDQQVLGYVERTKKGVAQYNDLSSYSTRLQVLLTIIYLVITLLLTIIAVWFGLSFARRLVSPISTLITASEHVKEGDLSARVDTTGAIDEFKMLGRAFNTMTEQIENQQEELMSANAQMDFRRRFTETILGGVSTGILSLDENGRVTLANNASGTLLMTDIEDMLGQKISYFMPDLLPDLDDAYAQDRLGAVKTSEIQLRRRDGALRTFIVRIVIEKIDDNQRGAILTFDDLTAVLATQKKAAWADVARRIAHEIKNPLTPIQLSAERLNRKYRKSLSDADKEIFDQCTDTIIRHVGDIKTMVNAFSDFAKIPDSVIDNVPIIPMIRDLYTLNKSAYPEIEFQLHVDDTLSDDIAIPHDEQQIRQVLTNLIKNAVEAMEESDKPKVIYLYCAQDDGHMLIGVEDNGVGLPDNHQGTLAEPYVTHKPKGTGLGLAIVKKIIEDHNGQLLFEAPSSIINNNSYDASKLTGACITISLPFQGEDQA